VVQFTSDDPTTKLYIFIIGGGLLFQSFEVIDFYFQSKVLSRYVSLCRFTQLVLSSILKLYFIFAKADLFFFVLVSFIDEFTLAAALAYSYWKRKLGMFLGQFQFRLAKEMLKDSWPLILSGFAVMIYMRIDQIMIKQMLGKADVGLYSAAVKLAEAWYFVPMIISSSLFPAILNARKRSKELYHKRLQDLYDLMVCLGLVVAIPMTCYSARLVTLLYGEAFRGAARVLVIYSWAGIFVSLGVASGKWLLSENLQAISAKNTVIGALINVVLNYVLIPRWGIVGAAIATVVSYSFAAYVLFLFHENTRKNFVMLSNSFNPIRLQVCLRRFIEMFVPSRG
jgi:O-antigen/teichoic acid export membrane protein